MPSLTQPFKFPRKVWLLVSLVWFFYLFFGAPINAKDDQPTAWRSLLEGEIGMVTVFGTIWLIVAFAFGALIATLLGICKQLFWGSK